MKLALGLMAIFQVVAGQTNDMAYVSLPETTSPGGFCNDGTMAGYYIREGAPDSSLFVIYLKGGGYCQSEDDCDTRKTSLKSSSEWGPYHTGKGLLSQDCATNPTFCDATAVHVPYCTSDMHRGNNVELLWDKYYFDGHTNFVAIVEKLILENGLGEAENVLLTGGSAGSVGALFNVDWLASRLPNANVKAVPYAGWYNPGALDGDLPPMFSPSDYAHFAADDNGNPFYDQYQNDTNVEDIFKLKDLLPTDCLEAYEDNEWWACTSADNAYRYIKSSMFVIHTQYDKNQIFTQNLAPTNPVDEVELNMTENYIEMWGEATRTSIQKILDNEIETIKAHPDGVFSASCFLHGTPENVEIDGMYWMDIVHDWFFQLGEYDSFHRLVETCPESNKELPCNAHKECTQFPFQQQPANNLKTCVRDLFLSGCMQSFQDRQLCLQCARSNQGDLSEAGCTAAMIKRVCKYAEKNDILQTNLPIIAP